MPATTFRLATHSDVDVLIEMMIDFYVLEEVQFHQERTRGALAELIDDSSLGRIWLIQSGDDVAGHVIVTFGFSLEFGGRDALLDELYLKENYRGQGIGRATLRFIEEFCQSIGISSIHLEVDHKNTAGQALYRKVGFVDHHRYLLTKWLSA